MHRSLCFALVLLWVGASSCVQSNFLEGVRCKNDAECGRDLRCFAGFCGGCPDDALLEDGRCGCPGDRIFECLTIDPVDACVAICKSESQHCGVAVVRDGIHEALPHCDQADPGQTCFRVLTNPDDCSTGESRIVLEPSSPPPSALIVNCPPPATPDGAFDCAD